MLLPSVAAPPFNPTKDQEDRAVTIAVLNRQIDNFIHYSPALATRSSVADRALGVTASTTLISHHDQVKFALAWARCEPTFVAQQYREWFGC